MCIIKCLFLNGHMYLSGIWFGVNLRTDKKTTTCFERDCTTFFNCVNHFRCHSQQCWQNLHDRLIIMRFFTLTMNRIFVHLSSENHEDSGYMHVLVLLFILHQLLVLYPTRSRCKTKIVCLRANYLMGLSVHKNVYLYEIISTLF